jgi:hypothetical protein
MGVKASCGLDKIFYRYGVCSHLVRGHGQAFAVGALAIAVLTACAGNIAPDGSSTATGGKSGGAGGKSGGAGDKSGGAGGASGSTMAALLPWPVAYDGAPSQIRRLSRDELIVFIEQIIGTAPAREDHSPSHSSAMGRAPSRPGVTCAVRHPTTAASTGPPTKQVGQKRLGCWFRSCATWAWPRSRPWERLPSMVP